MNAQAERGGMRPRLPSALLREVCDEMNEVAIDKACEIAAFAAGAQVLLTKERCAEVQALLVQYHTHADALAAVLAEDSTLHPETQVCATSLRMALVCVWH